MRADTGVNETMLETTFLYDPDVMKLEPGTVVNYPIYAFGIGAGSRTQRIPGGAAWNVVHKHEGGLHEGALTIEDSTGGVGREGLLSGHLIMHDDGTSTFGLVTNVLGHVIDLGKQHLDSTLRLIVSLDTIDFGALVTSAKVKLQHSSTQGSGFTDVATKNLSIHAAVAPHVYEIDSGAAKTISRYIRFVILLGPTTGLGSRFG